MAMSGWIRPGSLLQGRERGSQPHTWASRPRPPAGGAGRNPAPLQLPKQVSPQNKDRTKPSPHCEMPSTLTGPAPCQNRRTSQKHSLTGRREPRTPSANRELRPLIQTRLARSLQNINIQDRKPSPGGDAGRPPGRASLPPPPRASGARDPVCPLPGSSPSTCSVPVAGRGAGDTVAPGSASGSSRL